MALFNVYFDSSGTPDDCPAVVVGGFVAKAEQWIEFDRNWNDALHAYGVSRLHMREFSPAGVSTPPGRETLADANAS